MTLKIDSELQLSSKNVIWEDDFKVHFTNKPPQNLSLPKLIEYVLNGQNYVLKCLMVMAGVWILTILTFLWVLYARH